MDTFDYKKYLREGKLREGNEEILPAGNYQVSEYNIDGYDPINVYVQVTTPMTEEEILDRIGIKNKSLTQLDKISGELPVVHKV